MTKKGNNKTRKKSIVSTKRSVKMPTVELETGIDHDKLGI